MKIIFSSVAKNMVDVTRDDATKPEDRTVLGSLLKTRKPWRYWAESQQTQLSASELRAIARKLDKLNEEAG